MLEKVMDIGLLYIGKTINDIFFPAHAINSNINNKM